MPKFTTEELASLKRQGFTPKQIEELSIKGTIVGGETDDQIAEATVAAVVSTPVAKKTKKIKKSKKMKVPQGPEFQALRLMLNDPELGELFDLDMAKPEKSKSPALVPHPDLAAPPRMTLAPDEPTFDSPVAVPVTLFKAQVTTLQKIQTGLYDFFREERDSEKDIREERERERKDKEARPPLRITTAVQGAGNDIKRAFKNNLEQDAVGKLLSAGLLEMLEPLGSAALIAGAALGGWEIGSVIAQVMGLGDSSEALAKLFDTSGQSLGDTFDAIKHGMMETMKRWSFGLLGKTEEEIAAEEAGPVFIAERNRKNAAAQAAKARATANTSPLLNDTSDNLKTGAVTEPVPTNPDLVNDTSDNLKTGAVTEPVPTNPDLVNSPLLNGTSVNLKTGAVTEPVPTNLDSMSWPNMAPSAVVGGAGHVLSTPALAPTPTPAPTVGTPASVSTSATIQSVISSEKDAIIVKMSDGTIQKRMGSRSWRNNNPGNIIAGPGMVPTKDVGNGMKYAVFPDLATGEKARADLLFKSTHKYGKKGHESAYKDKTVSEAIATYVGDPKAVKAYQAVARKALGGIDPVMSTLTPEQQRTLLNAMKNHEGWKAGRVETLPNTISPLRAAGGLATTAPGGGSPVTIINNNTTNVAGGKSGGTVVMPFPVAPRNGDATLAALRQMNGLGG